MTPLRFFAPAALVLAAGLTAGLFAGTAQATLRATTTAPAGAVATGAEARLKYHVGNWDQMLTANGSFGGAGTVADLSNDRNVLYGNWWDFSLSFSAGTRTLNWSITDQAFGTRTLQAVEADRIDALRLEWRTTAPAFELRWADLAWSGTGSAPAGLTTAGSASGSSFTQWLVADAAELQQHDWQLTGSLLATGGNNENTRLSVLAYSVSAVPEPTTGPMLLAGLVAVAALARRRLAR